jgi:hypothetical protein
LSRAREQGIDLVGPDGMLTKVTKSVLEAALGVNILTGLFGGVIGLLGGLGADGIGGAFGVFVKTQGAVGAGAGAAADACG